jgi:hypothetical protein
MLGEEYIADQPSDENTLQDWNMWKNSVMTACQETFKLRHPWF